MIVLHVAKLDNNKASGVNVVVPQHVESQSIFETVAFVNISNLKI